MSSFSRHSKASYSLAIVTDTASMTTCSPTMNIYTALMTTCSQTMNTEGQSTTAVSQLMDAYSETKTSYTAAMTKCSVAIAIFGQSISICSKEIFFRNESLRRWCCAQPSVIAFTNNLVKFYYKLSQKSEILTQKKRATQRKHIRISTLCITP